MFQDPYALLTGIWLIVIIFVVVFFILGIALAVWVYKDAKKEIWMLQYGY